MKTILSHANLIDCVEPQLRPDTAVLIEDGRIRAILPSGEVDSAAGDAQVIDLKGGYLGFEPSVPVRQAKLTRSCR